MKSIKQNKVINDPLGLNNPENALNKTADNIDLNQLDNGIEENKEKEMKAQLTKELIKIMKR